MASVCISNCINDAHIPVRPTYINLYKWPESDAEFIRSVSSKLNRGTRVVNSISCRQMYLRSYTFSRDDDKSPEKTNTCFGNKLSRRKKKKDDGDSFEKKKKKKSKCSTIKKAKELSCAAFSSIFRRLLSCTSKVDVADNVRAAY